MIKGSKLISGFLVGIFAASLVMNAGATNIKNAKDKAETLEEQRNQAASEQKSLSARVKELSASMQQIQEDLDTKRAEIEETEQELIMSRIEESDQYESMKLRIRYMYENGNVDFISLLLESDSVTDFLGKAEYVAKMSEYDRKKLDEYQQTIRAVEEKELALQAEYQELEQLQNTLVSQQAEAENLLAKKNAELDNLDSELKEIKAQIARAEEEAKKKQEAEDSQDSNLSTEEAGESVVSGNGYFAHPCPGMSYQSSYFGEIRTSIGDPVPHKGHDYAAPAGTPIYAAAAGEVIIAGYSTTAGNWVVISHGNGLVTKYMHMYRSPLVSAGDTVEKGQHIGGVGTTGQSTGNHLHFQVEKNGVPVNPSIYM